MNEQFRPKTNYAETEMARILASVRNSGLPLNEQNAKLQQIFKSYGIDWKIPEGTSTPAMTPATPQTVRVSTNPASGGSNENFFKTEQERIAARLRLVPEDQRAELLKTILLNEYGIRESDLTKLGIDPKFIQSLLGGTAFAGVALAVMLNFSSITNFTGNTFKNTGTKLEKVTHDKNLENNTRSEKELNLEPREPNPRFSEVVFEALPNNGKEVYMYFATQNPTPGRGYMFLDKENALQYVFDANNNLIARIVAGFGQQEGDAPNTSAEYNKGNMTTPSGVYLLSNNATTEDIKEYGKLQLAMLGISVLGNKEFLGAHQTYAQHGELEKRTSKLISPTPKDNKFSNGCINIDAKNFEEYIKNNFKGDFGELLFVLPDAKSRASGVAFNVAELVHLIAPVIAEMAAEEEKICLASLNQLETFLVIKDKELQTLKRQNKNTAQIEKEIETAQQRIEDKKKELERIRQKYLGVKELV